MRIANVVVVGCCSVVVFWAGRRGSSRGRGTEAHMYCPCRWMFDVFVLARVAVDWLRLLLFLSLLEAGCFQRRWRGKVEMPCPVM